MGQNILESTERFIYPFVENAEHDGSIDTQRQSTETDEL
jgi:hypothetical protein